MPLSPPPERVDTMHRQIAGKLTGPVTKWIVLVGVLVLLGIFGSLAGKLTSVQNNEAESWLPQSAESSQAIKRLEAFQDPTDLVTTVVYYKASGLTQEDLAAIESHGPEIADIEGVSNVITPQSAATAGIPAPYVSEDGQVAKLDFTINRGDALWEDMPDVADEVRDITAIPGVEVYVAGAGGTTADQAAAFAGMDGRLLLITLCAVILILLVSYRSPVLWALPIFCAVVSLGIAMGVLYLLAKYGNMTINGQTQFIMTVLVIGAGTDYALLLVARYREELRRHEDRHEAMAFALHRAGPAILASGATVIAGMLCLLFASMSSTKGLGPVAAIGVGVALLVMLTLLPALLVVLGRWVFWPVRPTFGSVDHTRDGVWARIGARIAGAPRRTWVVTTLLLVIASLGVLQLNAVGLSNKDSYYTTPQSVVGEEILARHFPAGAGSPVLVLANAPEAAAVKKAVASVDGVGSVGDPVVRGDRALVQATLKAAPDSDAAGDTVQRVRDAIATVPGADAIAGGDTATRVDTLAASSDDNLRIIPVVLGVVLLILVLLLRALTAPLVLIGTVLLSFGAAIGLSALVFRHVLGFAGADSSFPLFVFVFLVALGIDYNIFLMTRVHEEAKKVGTWRGSLVGLAATGGVITSAGLVLAGTFAVLATMPIVAFAEIGFAVALGVLLDTLIVRSVLVTALNLDIGARMWWPSRLARTDAATTAAAAERPEPAAEPALHG